MACCVNQSLLHTIRNRDFPFWVSGFGRSIFDRCLRGAPIGSGSNDLRSFALEPGAPLDVGKAKKINVVPSHGRLGSGG
jgi:hypothetical protein